ncbi:MAG TPA: DUF2007 domain-containing protein [Acidimicrobiia bacterium]|nr:DUF2007 domain-containing protein [Acidimicrobiia bacterium]
MGWAVAHVAYSRPDAEVIAALLRGHGIENFVAGDDPTGPEFAFVQGIEVRVHEEDLEMAKEILRDGADEVV